MLNDLGRSLGDNVRHECILPTVTDPNQNQGDGQEGSHQNKATLIA